MKAYEILQRRHEEQQRSTRYWIDVDVERVKPEALFRHEFWANQANLRKGDILRCVASDGSYDFELRVNGSVVKEGKRTVTVGFYPIVPDFIIEAAESEEPTKQMATHVNGKPVPRVENVGAEGWRVIGFSGEVVSHNHEHQAAATLAMAHYVNDAGITAVSETASSGHVYEQAPASPPPARLTPETARPGQFSRAKAKADAKREERRAKQRANDEANKARTAARLAAEAAAGEPA